LVRFQNSLKHQRSTLAPAFFSQKRKAFAE